MKLKKVFRGLAAALGFLFFTVNGLTVGMFKNEGFINDALGISSSDTSGGDADVHPYNSEFAVNINEFTEAELAAKNAAALEFIEREEEEGAVLLKNDNGALPLTDEQIKKVTLLGWAAAHPYYRSHSGGGGSNGQVSLKDALVDRGFVINQKVYDALAAINGNRKNTAVVEADVSAYDKTTFGSYGEAAIVVLSREAGENDDLQVAYNDEGTVQSMLALTKKEKALLDLVKKNKDNGTFKKVIVLLNTSNTMEVGWLDEYGVDACLWIGGPGQSSGFYGVADLLKGDANPSGKLVDTYSASSLSAPSMMNYITSSKSYNDNLIYAEGIYVGYKYYETRYEDCILGQGNADCGKGVYASDGAWNYADEVTYPFGYGLSYSSGFTQTLKNVADNGDGTMTLTVTVENAEAKDGGVKGKSIIQVYAQTPYGDYEKHNSVEKSAIQLVAFEKTDDLEPGASKDCTVTVDKYFLASYDYKTAQTYYLSDGQYYLAIGDDAHDALNNVLAEKGATGLVDSFGNAVDGDADKVYGWREDADFTTYKHTASGAEVENQLQEMDWNHFDDGKITYLSRSDWQTTYPVEYSSLTKTANMVATDVYTKPADAPKATEVVTGKDSGIKFAQMYGVAIDEKDKDGVNKWDKFIDQLTMDEVISTTIDVKGIDAIGHVGFPGGVNDDGIDGVSVNCYINPNVAAASWNKSLLQRRGEFIGEDCLYRKLHTQWGPGANFHRAPFSGRNFEYFSEDPYLYYELAGAQVYGTESKGVTVAIKHFFANDQEERRGTYCVFANEQTLRETYLRPFEGAFVKGGATSTMTSNAKVGFRFVGESDGLVNGILHEEWGFFGIIITDAGGGFTDPAEYVAKGGNMFCFVGDKKDRAQKMKMAVLSKNDGNLLNIYKENAKEILYTYAHTNIMNNLTADTEILDVTPWWKSAMIAINVVIGLLTVGAIVCFVLWGYVFKKNGGDKNEKTEGDGNEENT